MLNGTFRRHGCLGFSLCLAIWAIASSIYAQLPEATKSEANQPAPVKAVTPVNLVTPISIPWVIVTIVLLLAIVAGFLLYMFILQRRFFNACKEEKQLTLFFQSPAGLPIGTVRSIIALIIVTTSLYFGVLQAFRGFPFPEALTAVLGTVIGFYFGSRAASRGPEEPVSDQVEQLQAERDQAVAEKDSVQTDALLKKVEKGIALTKTAAELLPANIRDKYNDAVTKLEQGLNIVESLSKSGNATEAAAKAAETLELFKTSNPVRDMVVKASQSFSRVLGGAVPPLAIISAIVGVSTSLIGVVYQKWKARILHLPFSPVIIPLKVVDANTGFVLFLQSPIFKAAFTDKLEENDRPFMESAVEEFLRQEDVETLWGKYKDRFESRDQFESGLEEFRRAAASLELENDINPRPMVEVGGYKPLMTALDQIYADTNARSDLDSLVVVIEGLQKSGEPVQSIFDKVREEVSS